MKSDTMALWEGLKLPYQMRLIGILPERRGPLWYSRRVLGWFWTNSVSFLAAREIWKREIRRRSCGMRDDIFCDVEILENGFVVMEERRKRRVDEVV